MRCEDVETLSDVVDLEKLMKISDLINVKLFLGTPDNGGLNRLAESSKVESFLDNN